MRTVPPAILSAFLLLLVVTALLLTAIASPQMALALLPAAAALMLALLFYEAPLLAIGLLIVAFGLAFDLQFGEFGGPAGLGPAIVKLLPFGIAAMLCLRYGFAPAINWPFIAFFVILAISLIVLPMGRVSTFGEMMRSFTGSIAPFVIAFAAAPRPFWSALCKAVVLVPLISATVGLLLWPTGLQVPFDPNWRFMGMHSAPFLAGFCTTAIFAATLEYLRSFRLRWLVLGGAALAVLLLTQARAPLGAVALFLVSVLLFSGRHTFPLRRKVDLAMGGLLPAAILFLPLIAIGLDRFVEPDGATAYSGRDVIWPLFVDAIETRPLFGYGLGAGKLLVDPEDPDIRLIQSNAAHNEYLRLAVEGGILGAGLIIVSLIAWVWLGTRRVFPADRLVLRWALAAALLHAAFDNTLIASTAVIQFSWFAAALARARLDRQEADHGALVRRALARRARGA